jgi:hypothetical protein
MAIPGFTTGKTWRQWVMVILPADQGRSLVVPTWGPFSCGDRPALPWPTRKHSGKRISCRTPLTATHRTPAKKYALAGGD